MNYRIPLAGLLATIAMYVWMSVAQMSPLGMVGFSVLPEAATPTAAMQAAMGDRDGLFVFPPYDPSAPNAMAAHAEKEKTSASGLMIYHPAGKGPQMSPATLGLEFLKELVCCMAAAFLLAEAADSIGRYAVRVAFVGVIGVVAAFTTNLSNSIWYGYPGAYIATQVAMTWVGYVIAGLVLAAMIRPSTNPKPPIT